MPVLIYLLGSAVVMVAYAAIAVAIAVPVARAGQLRTNRLATATALIFFSSAVGYGLQAVLWPGGSWPLALWSLFTACVGVYYWILRRRNRLLLGGGALYPDPGRQHLLDAAGARERAAKDVAESHRATLAAVVEHSEEAIMGTALDGTLTAWNGGAERLFGYTADEALGRPISMIADAPHRRDQGEILARLGRGERVCYEARRVHKDGTQLDVSVSATPITDSYGNIIGFAFVGRDIKTAKAAAERRRLIEERTHQAQRMESLGKLAGGVAHDFNNILAIIVNYTAFAAEQSAGNPDVQADLENVRRAADRAISLTHQLLVFTRGDTIQPHDMDLNASIDEVAAMLQRTIGEHIQLATRRSPVPLTIHADPGQIQQILLNLSLNARDAMPDGGTLVIEAGLAALDEHQVHTQPPLGAGTYARLLVCDNGEGMAPEVARHIFEPFFTTKPQGKGTGLGLATVYGVVTEAGGGINVYSEPGVGTTFRVYLPLIRTPSDNHAPAPSSPGVVPRGRGETVLVVEDEPALGRIVARILTEGGYLVLSAVSGPDALALDAEQGCDMLLTDVIMPEMSGPRLVELLEQRHSGLPVLFMSGYSDGLLGSHNVLDPDIAFIEKPFTGEGLLRAVDAVLHAAAPDRCLTPQNPGPGS
ncbi:PAS domain S-box protein [Actinoplanes sp. NPDC049118]|uniref:PAS domain-containing hybrid sensor histidine kinase/response regulator n=1 Tax=Actinoplanes sp. NPDC049118 TaxID=3155769 RepID=UPI0033FE6D2F